MKKPGKEYTFALWQLQPVSMMYCGFCVLLRKKWPLRDESCGYPGPFFDLLRLFADNACSKITQIFLSLT